MEDIKVFSPIGAGGEVDATSSAATTTIRADRQNTPGRIRFVNHGAVKVRIRLMQDGTQTAVTDTTGFVLMPGVTEVHRLNGATSFSAKTESGTTDLNWQLGSGV